MSDGSSARIFSICLQASSILSKMLPEGGAVRVGRWVLGKLPQSAVKPIKTIQLKTEEKVGIPKLVEKSRQVGARMVPSDAKEQVPAGRFCFLDPGRDRIRDGGERTLGRITHAHAAGELWDAGNEVRRRLPAVGWSRHRRARHRALRMQPFDDPPGRLRS